VDDSSLIRQGIRAVLSLPGHDVTFDVVAEAGTAAEGLAAARIHRPDLALLDIRLPDGSGIDTCRQILAELPATRVVMLTSYSNDNLVYDAIVAGAQGYLLKEIDPQALLSAMSAALAGRSVLSPEITSHVMQFVRGKSTATLAADSLAKLSPQETRVLALVADGLTNKLIGAQLNLSENTVKNHLLSVFEKLAVRSRSQAAARYVRDRANPGPA
jgi:two-component system response regulator DevR